MWATRIIAESKCHAVSSFVTLTYDEDKLPQYGSLRYRDWQLFAKRLRKRMGPFRFFVSGEYGPATLRPHYHAIIFGLDFAADRAKCNSVYSSSDLYTSVTLEKLWPHGFHTIGAVSATTARYVASYTLKKCAGERAEEKYMRVIAETGEVVHVEPEFGKMSLKPGIGFEWFTKYWREVYTHDGIVIDGKLKPVPRYFDQLVNDGRVAPEVELDFVKLDRSAKVDISDSTRERLAVREQCAAAQVQFNKLQRKGAGI